MNLCSEQEELQDDKAKGYDIGELPMPNFKDVV